MKKAMLWSAMLLAGMVSAADYYVDNAKGNDSNPGTAEQPFRTCAKALNTMKGSDTLHLVPNETPYCDLLIIKEKLSGTPDALTIIDGHGARFDGMHIFRASAWKDEGNGIFSRPLPNNAWPMDRSGCWSGDFAIVTFNGKDGINCKARADLAEYHYFLLKSHPSNEPNKQRNPLHNTLYIKLPSGKTPDHVNVGVFTGEAKISVEFGKNILIKNVSMTRTAFDCFSTFGAENCIFDNISGSFAMDQGISSHGSKNIIIRNSRFHNNAGGGIVDVTTPKLPCSVRYENCVIENNFFRSPIEFYGKNDMDGAGCYEMINCTIRNISAKPLDTIQVNQNAKLTLKKCTLTGSRNNRGIVGGNLIVEDCSFKGFKYGIFNSSKTPAIIERCTFEDCIEKFYFRYPGSKVNGIDPK